MGAKVPGEYWYTPGAIVTNTGGRFLTQEERIVSRLIAGLSWV